MRVLFYHPDGVADGEARAFVGAARGLAGMGWHVVFATHAGAARADPASGTAESPHGALSPAAALAAGSGVRVLLIPPSTSLVGATAELSRAIRTEMAEVVFVHGDRGQVVGAGAVWRAGRGTVVRRVGAGETLAPTLAARVALRVAATGFLCTWADQAAVVPGRVRAAAVIAELGVPEHSVGDEAATREVPIGGLAGVGAVGVGIRVRCTVAPGSELRAALVLRAAAMIAPRHRALQLTFVGPGACDESLQLHAAALGVGQHLSCDDGPIPDSGESEVAWVIAEGDAGGFGVLDAMAAGIPVLAERGSTAASYVADGITGLHLPPGDVAAGAAALARLLGHPETRGAMGAAGRSRVRRAYPAAAMVDGFARAAAAVRDRTRWRG